MKDRILKEAKNFGIDLIGFTSEESFLQVIPIIKKRMEKGYLSPFLHVDLEKNSNPSRVWSDTKSIISVGVAYNNNLENYKSDTINGNISKVAWGQDYHSVLMNKMNGLMSQVMKDYPELQYKTYVDNAPLLDRAIACRSGIGFYGRNGFIINPIYGSYIFLGHILVNVKLEKSNTTDGIASQCGNCNKCIQGCPTDALKDGYEFNANKCISYLTQKKELLYRWERKAMGKSLYGCDICQEVCPINKKAKMSRELAFLPIKEVIRPRLADIVNMDNPTFKKLYGTTAAGWRGRKNLQRNAIIIAGNIICEENYEMLKHTLHDGRWEIRLYSMFSLLEYTEQAINIVKERLKDEDQEFIDKFELFRE